MNVSLRYANLAPTTVSVATYTTTTTTIDDASTELRDITTENTSMKQGI